MADEAKVQDPGIEQNSPEVSAALDTDKVPKQAEAENLTGPAADG